jgi:predicted nucleotide-binding protein
MPNGGRTIIEKFEDYADASFAVVLLTGDDVAGLADVANRDLRPRARQNVVFELGFFLGRLGREQVAVLYEPGVEIPSDYSGVLYIELDPQQHWQRVLARELKNAGYELDLKWL